MNTKARVRLVYALGGLALLIVIAVAAFAMTRVVSLASEEPSNVTRVQTVIVVTATPAATLYVTPEVQFLGVDFASPVDVSALYNRCPINPSDDCLNVQATAVAGDVVYIEGKLYQVYHLTPNTGEFAFDNGDIVTLTLYPVFPTTALPDEFPNSLRIQLQ